MTTQTALAERPQNGAGEAQSRPRDAVATVRSLLVRMGPDLQKALPEHVSRERLERIALTVLQNSYQLQQCDVKSLLGAIMQAAQLGLEPDPVLGHCYFVPFAKKVTFIVGYKGYIELARRSGLITKVWARAVRKQDVFEVMLGTDERITHVPDFGASPGDVIAAYACMKFSNGDVQFEVMPRRDLDRIRDASLAQKKNPDASPWKVHEEAMQIKCPIRRLGKVMPLSPSYIRAMQIDDDAEEGRPLVLDSKVSEILAALPDDPGSDDAPPKEDKLGDLARKAQEKAAPSKPSQKQVPQDVAEDAEAAFMKEHGNDEQPCAGCRKQVPLKLTTKIDGGKRICPDCDQKRKELAKKGLHPDKKAEPAAPAKGERKETAIEKAERLDRERIAEEARGGNDDTVASDVIDRGVADMEDSRDDGDNLDD